MIADAQASELLPRLRQALALNHEVVTGARIRDRQFALWARSKTTLQHYALHKRLVVEQADLRDEIVVAGEPEYPDAALLRRHLSWLEGWSAGAVRSGARHMQSRFILLLLLQSDRLPPRFQAMASRCRRIHAHKLGWHGWTEILVLCHHLATAATYGHRGGRDLKHLMDRLQKERSVKTT